jgi:hypothetical protein
VKTIAAFYCQEHLFPSEHCQRAMLRRPRGQQLAMETQGAMSIQATPSSECEQEAESVSDPCVTIKSRGNSVPSPDSTDNCSLSLHFMTANMRKHSFGSIVER